VWSSSATRRSEGGARSSVRPCDTKSQITSELMDRRSDVAGHVAPGKCSMPVFRPGVRRRARVSLASRPGSCSRIPPGVTAPLLIAGNNCARQTQSARPVRRVSVSVLALSGVDVAYVQGLGGWDSPRHPSNLASLSYSAGQPPFVPVPPHLSRIRSGGDTWDASRTTGA
jgi:hypothetical protein